MTLSTEWYRVFYICSRTLSFSKAAEQLFVSQSSVSQSIKQLEQALGVKLFYRTTKQMSLTPEGESLYRHVQSAFEAIQAGEEQLKRLQNLDDGMLRIGVSDTLSKYYLLPYLQRFHQSYPKVKIRISNRPSPKSVEDVLANDIDLAIVNLLEDMQHPQLSIYSLKEFKDIFIAGEAFRYLQGIDITETMLSELPLIHLEQGSTTRRFFDAHFSGPKGSLVPEIEIGSVDLILELVRIGLGIGFVPQYTLKSQPNVFQLQLNFDYPSRAIAAIKRKTDYPQASVKKFLELLQSDPQI